MSKEHKRMAECPSDGKIQDGARIPVQPGSATVDGKMVIRWSSSNLQTHTALRGGQAAGDPVTGRCLTRLDAVERRGGWGM
jgi:hypothetical protein